MFKKIFLAAMLLAVLAAGWWWQAGGGVAGKLASQPAPVRVKVAAVQRQDVPQNIRLAATVYANATVTVKSRLDSQVTEVRFQDGGKVAAGDVLFVLDDRALKARRAQLAANLQRDQVQLKNAKAQYERSLKLSTQDYVASEKLELDKTAYEAQQAGVTATKAALDNLDIELDYTIIRAPIGGRVGTIAVTVGNNVKANDTTPLVTINQIDPIMVQFAVPQRHYDALRQAMARGKVPVTALRPESGVVLTGNLEYIDNAIDQTNGSFAARARFDNPEEKLWPGMFVDVSVKLDTLPQVLTLPSSAVMTVGGRQFVFAVTPEGKAARRAVTARMEDDLAIIGQGLEEGDKVVTDGLLRVTEGAALAPDSGSQAGSAPPETAAKAAP